MNAKSSTHEGPNPVAAAAVSQRPASADRRTAGYVALVLGIPIATIIAGVVTLWIAIDGADAVTPQAHVKRGLAIEQPADATRVRQP